MGLNYALLRNLTAREIISALIRDGFEYDRGSGSHQIFYHSDGRRVSVTFHSSRAFSRLSWSVVGHGFRLAAGLLPGDSPTTARPRRSAAAAQKGCPTRTVHTIYENALDITALRHRPNSLRTFLRGTGSSRRIKRSLTAMSASSCRERRADRNRGVSA